MLLQAIARAFDAPARNAMFVTLVPESAFPNAASLNGISWRLSDILGPVLMAFLVESGHLFSVGGVALCYGFNFVSYFAVLVAVWFLPASRPKTDVDRARTLRDVLSRIGEGWRFVNGTPVVRHAMYIDFWATLFSGAEALLPAYAVSILKVGPKGLGILAASTGMGALLAAAAMAWFPTIRHQGRTVVLMVGAYGLATVCFGIAPNLWIACLSLGAVGASDMVSTVLRQTIRQLATPDSMRGRMNATCSLFHISGPQLGDAEAGAVASIWGERISIALGGGLCLFVAGWWSRTRDLMEYTHRSEPPLLEDQGSAERDFSN